MWHTRGEGNRAWYPEVFEYHGYSKGFTATAIFKSLVTPPNWAGAVQLLLAWARRYDENRVSRPAESAWITNGFNWTGTFWSTGFSVPIPPRFTLVGSYYQSFPFMTKPKNTAAWLGVSLGLGASGKFNVKSPFSLKTFFKLDVTKVLDFKKLGLSINEAKTEYGLIYGNGSDYIPQRNNRDITGLHWPINQNDFPE